MKYILMICSDERDWARLSDTEQQKMMLEYRALREELRSSGQYVDGSRLHPTSAATSVRVRDGKRLVTDGPFAETREQLAGYFVVDAKDLDDAIGIAARMPGARVGTVEVRPLAETPAN
jgi:hypothetical protein